jgi:hypothetical protein
MRSILLDTCTARAIKSLIDMCAVAQEMFMGIVERRSVPGEVRAIDPLADMSSAKPRSPAQWARAIFEDAPVAMRWFLLLGWRAGLGLRLGPVHSPAHVHVASEVSETAASATSHRVRQP